MKILSQTDDARGYHGTIGTPTNMYDCRGERLFVGDVVSLKLYNDKGEEADDYGIEFVCEEDTEVADWTGKNHQYVMGIAGTYNSESFKILEGIKVDSEEWQEKFEKLDTDFRVYKVKSHSILAINEQIGFLKVIDFKGDLKG